ncbi:MAG: LysR substrate-binding domain-containing protein [Methyloligellaceae bacterium]
MYLNDGEIFADKLDRKVIPSLSTLVIFESAATHSSFLKAAQELGRTPSAVSRSISELEHRLKCVLFQRNGKKVFLTKQGFFYLNEVRKALNALLVGERMLASRKEENFIRLQVPPSFATLVLMPNLSEFYSNFPDVKVEIQVEQNHAEWSRQNLDIEIRMCGIEDESLYVKRLGQLKTVPVCSPGFTYSVPKPKSIDQIINYRFLHLNVKHQTWPKLFRRAGYDDLEISYSLSFNNSHTLIEAVRNGLGIGMGVYPFIFKYHDYGKGVVMLFDDLGVSSDLSYNFVCRKSALETSHMKRIMEWFQYIFDRALEPYGKIA